MGDPFSIAHRAAIISAAARNHIPAVYRVSVFSRDGGLLSYRPVIEDLYPRSAAYVDRILRGAKPSDPPVQFPTKFELLVNLKTAKALGLTVPQTLLVAADELSNNRYLLHCMSPCWPIATVVAIRRTRQLSDG